ncbi:MAG TPA: bifunctional biotin--[acetyl-CoA-carboxylase] synthetase/biotin operon repressor, partial [Acidimicrobiales bacterium]|nr:bifunctional biotin--[acetyl-CoA-carboxylase] synthetase/biotin operon repressor [Acidimicrobiales bacterium]
MLDAAREGAPEGTVAVADHQTAGRGRLGRVWVAPPGASLLVSILLRPSLPPDRLHLATAAVALSAAAALEEVAGFRPGLKWPNDL